MSIWIIALAMLGISSVAGAINFIMTMLRLRAPGMSWRRMPMFVHRHVHQLVPHPVRLPQPHGGAAACSTSTASTSTGWYNPARGGDPIIWQHLFWFFGHPEVYILILPAFGMMSEIVPVFARKPLFGRMAMIISLAAIGFLGFLVWAHHMFTAGLPNYFNAIMAGTQHADRHPHRREDLQLAGHHVGRLAALEDAAAVRSGLIALFTVGGISGVLQASVPFDWQVNDSFFIVAHLHNVLFAGTAFAAFAGFYYWFPKMTGRMLSDRLGKWHFWVITVGFLLTFLPMYALGLLGMPRRLYTYAPNLGWSTLDLISAIGAYIIGVAIVIFVVNIVRSLHERRAGRRRPLGRLDARVGDHLAAAAPATSRRSPGCAASAPCSTPSRPARATARLPVTSCRPAASRLQATWNLPAARRRPADADRPGRRRVVADTAGRRSWPPCTPLPAHADHWTKLPIVTALAVVVIGVGLLTTLLVSAVGVGLLLIIVALWLQARWTVPEAPVVPNQRFTALGSGMLLLIGSEVVLFGALVSADLHLRIHNGLVTLGTARAAAAHAADRQHRHPHVERHRRPLRAHQLSQGPHGLVPLLPGADARSSATAFLGGQAWEYTHAGFGLSSGLTGSSFFTLTGLHGAHVVAGILLLVYLLFHSAGDRPRRPVETGDDAAAAVARGTGTAGMVEAAVYYWHFVDAVWVVIFVVVYLL